MSNLISRIEILKTIITYDNAIIKNYTLKQAEIKNNVGELKASRNQLTDIKADNTKKLADLNLNINEQKNLLSRLQPSKDNMQMLIKKQ